MLCYDAACEGENWLAVVTDAVQQQLLLFGNAGGELCVHDDDLHNHYSRNQMAIF